MLVRQLALEWCIHKRQMRRSLNTCLFFLMISVFFPLTLPPSADFLRNLAPGLIWIALLLALLLSAERLFQQESDDGVLEQWFLSGQSVSLFIGAKIIAHSVFNLAPMILMCPLFGVLFHLNVHEIVYLILSILCGAPSIMALCALSAAFSTGLKQKGIFMALILFPLTLPILIFGSATSTAAMQGQVVSGYLALLLAFSCVTLAAIPCAIASIMRITLADF